MKLRTWQKAAFTLVELLTVMSIICIMLVATVPAIQGLSKSSSRQAAVNMLMDVMDQARGLAITQGRPAYVVFADGNLPGDKMDRAVCIFSDNSDPAQPPSMQTKWSTLPTGYCFKNDSSVSTILNAPADTPAITFSGQGFTKVAFPYVRFSATGEVLHPTNPNYSRIVLLNGFTNPNGTQVSTSPSTVTDQIVVSRYTGRPKYVNGL